VTYTALAVLLFVLCAGLGAMGGSRVARRPWVAATFAAAMVAAQFALLVSSR